MGDEGDGTVSGFVLRPLGGPGLPYFQSSYPQVWERSRIPPSPPPFPPWLILFPLSTPRHHVPSIIIPCSCCPRAPFKVDQGHYYGCRQWSVFPTDHHIKCTLHHLMPPPLPCLLASEDRGSSGRSCKSLFFSKKTSNQCWRRCHHKVATLVDLHFFVSWTCHERAIFMTGEGARANRGGVHDGGALLPLVFATMY